MRKIKAILFDMDGVLIDAREWHYEALNQSLAIFGMEINKYDHLVTYDGLPTRKKLEILSIERGLPVALHGFINDLKQSFTLKLGYTKCKPTFLHQYALSKLKKDGYKIAACSNSIRKTMDVFFEMACLTQYFDLILSNEDVEQAKPNPAIYQLAMRTLDVMPDECLILEDNDHGIQAARESGANLLIIRDPNEVSLTNIKNKIAQIEG